MALKRPNFNQDIIESATDPTIGGLYTITAGSIWLDISGSPAILKERNSANTSWSAINSASGALGRYTDVFVATLNQTTFTLTYTPASQADIEVLLVNRPGRQDPANITGLSGKVVTVITGLRASESVAFSYTRLD